MSVILTDCFVVNNIWINISMFYFIICNVVLEMDSIAKKKFNYGRASYYIRKSPSGLIVQPEIIVLSYQFNTDRAFQILRRL
jgi:hypothetical protein